MLLPCVSPLNDISVAALLKIYSECYGKILQTITQLQYFERYLKKYDKNVSEWKGNWISRRMD